MIEALISEAEEAADDSKTDTTARKAAEDAEMYAEIAQERTETFQVSIYSMNDKAAALDATRFLVQASTKSAANSRNHIANLYQ
jgi:hypothetical protein